METLWLSLVFDVVNLVLAVSCLSLIIIVKRKLEDLIKKLDQPKPVEQPKKENNQNDIKNILILYGRKVGL